MGASIRGKSWHNPSRVLVPALKAGVHIEDHRRAHWAEDETIWWELCLADAGLLSCSPSSTHPRAVKRSRPVQAVCLSLEAEDTSNANACPILATTE